MMLTAFISACCLSVDERVMIVHLNTLNVEGNVGEKPETVHLYSFTAAIIVIN